MQLTKLYQQYATKIQSLKADKAQLEVKLLQLQQDGKAVKVSFLKAFSI
jgi:hypothetical protein